MKKILGSLVIAGLSCLTANAQSTQINVCGVKSDKVCKPSADRKTSYCYKTSYAENFKICKDDYGYFICCETRGLNNATYPRLPIVEQEPPLEYQSPDVSYVNRNTTPDKTIPQSQSYVGTSADSYEGYYINGSGMKSCYGGNNVAENNRAPYKGCPSPQSEGPAVNNRRNINVSNPVNLAPITGRQTE